MLKKRAPLKPWQEEDARRLRELYKAKVRDAEVKLNQTEFGENYKIGTQGMVWQFLNGRTPLHLVAAAKFANGMQCHLDEISPTLAQQARDFVLPALRQPQKDGKAPSKKALGVEKRKQQTDRRYESLQSDELELLHNYRKLREIGDGAPQLLSNAAWLLSEALRGRSGADIIPITRGARKRKK